MPVFIVERVEVLVEKVVEVERVVEKLVEVQVVVEKVVPERVYVPQLVTVELQKEVLATKTQIVVAKEIENHVQLVPELVERVVEKPIPLVQTVEKLVEVPKVV